VNLCIAVVFHIFAQIYPAFTFILLVSDNSTASTWANISNRTGGLAPPAIIAGSFVVDVVQLSVYLAMMCACKRCCPCSCFPDEDPASPIVQCANRRNGWCAWLSVVLPCSLVIMGCGVAVVVLTVVLEGGFEIPIISGALTVLAGLLTLLSTLPSAVQKADPEGKGCLRVRSAACPLAAPLKDVSAEDS
jgi:hypothetical protein